MLFILHGAPDLALTQVLVETVSLVVFVLVLRRLPAVLHRPAAAPRPLPAGWRCRRSRRRWPSPGSCWSPPAPRTADAGLRGLPGGGRRVRRRPQHRQRDPRRHPGLGHLRRDLGAGRGRDRGGQPDLPGHPHDGHPAGLRHPLPGRGRRSSRPGRAAGSGCPARARCTRRPPLDHLRGGHPADLPGAHRVRDLPAVRRAQRARRRLRRRHGHRAGADGPLPGRRPLRARRGGAGRRRHADGHRAVRGRGLRARPARLRRVPCLQSAERRPGRPAARRAAPGHLVVLRHRRLPRRGRAGAGPAAHPRLPDRPTDPPRGARGADAREPCHEHQPEP